MRQIRTYRLICEGNCSDADALARADRLADEAASAYRNPRIGQTAAAGLTLPTALRACAVTAHRMRPTDVAACTVCGSVRVFG